VFLGNSLRLNSGCESAIGHSALTMRILRVFFTLFNHIYFILYMFLNILRKTSFVKLSISDKLVSSLFTIIYLEIPSGRLFSYKQVMMKNVYNLGNWWVFL
jgi:hypothetical protein